MKKADPNRPADDTTLTRPTANTPQFESLIPEASTFVYTLFKEKLPETIVYHTYEHTVEVADAAGRIARKSSMSRNKQGLLELAAWFHDVGFTETYENHEEAGVRIAAGFLEAHDVPDEYISQVADLIRATQSGHEPRDAAEEVMHDADFIHIGKKGFLDRSARLRKEWEYHRGETYSDLEWTEAQLRFLTSTDFVTDYARKKYGSRRQKNIRSIQKALGAVLSPATIEAEVEKARLAPSRGIETMFRSAYRNHINLSSIADSKANIMISINAILMSIIISFVSSRLQTNPWLMIPSATLLLTSLVSIVYAILSARPTVTSKVFTLEDVRQNRSNILFFGNFVNMGVDDFTVGMRELMQDWDRLYENMISDIFSLGQVLSKKYRLLWISYTVFMIGLAVSVTLFLILFFV